MQATVIAANSQTFSYDNQDRLTSWSKAAGVSPAQTQSWTLTPVGDWSATVRDGVTENRTHTKVHEIATVNATALGYDAKGNLTLDDQQQTYTWDQENRLATATVPPRAGSLGVSASYLYDALGRRLAKTVNGRTTRFLHDGAQVIVENELAEIPSQVALNGTDADGTVANGAMTPANGGILAGTGVRRINFQPETSAVPAGFLADKGKTYGVRTNGQSYGWTVAQTSRQQARNYQTLAELDTCARMQPTAGDTPGVWEIALPNGTYPVIVVCGDPLSTGSTNNLLIEGGAVTDPDPSVAPGYVLGDFDGYAVTRTVSDGKLTITTGTGAADPKLCFVEIGAAGGTIDTATQTRLADMVQKATDATYSPKLAFASRAYVYASYIDEPVMMVSGTGTKSYFHQNHLYTVAAMTNNAGMIVERYRYDAYGRRTVTNAAGMSIATSTIGQQRGFTGYYLDTETSLSYARARMYSAGLGRFTGRDPKDYVENRLGVGSKNQSLYFSDSDAYRNYVTGDRFAERSNLYQFLSGNPGQRLDPSGLFSLEVSQNTWRPLLCGAYEWDVNFQLNQNAGPAGGWIVQRVTVTEGDAHDCKTGVRLMKCLSKDQTFTEAWFVQPGTKEPAIQIVDGYADRFAKGGQCRKCSKGFDLTYASVQYFDGLSLPASMQPHNVPNAGDLPSAQGDLLGQIRLSNAIPSNSVVHTMETKWNCCKKLNKTLVTYSSPSF